MPWRRLLHCLMPQKDQMDKTDPLYRLSMLRIIKASQDLEKQLSTVAGGGPSVEILRRLRDKAAESLAALVIVDAEDPRSIRELQNEVKRYDEWVGWLREIISEGIMYDKKFTEDERNEMIDLLTASPEGERQAIELGLIDDIPRDA